MLLRDVTSSERNALPLQMYKSWRCLINPVASVLVQELEDHCSSHHGHGKTWRRYPTAKTLVTEIMILLQRYRKCPLNPLMLTAWQQGWGRRWESEGWARSWWEKTERGRKWGKHERTGKEKGKGDKKAWEDKNRICVFPLALFSSIVSNQFPPRNPLCFLVWRIIIMYIL